MTREGTSDKSPGVGWVVWATLALLALLGLTAVASVIDLGRAGPAVGLAIAAIKAVIVAWWFMELRESAWTVRLVACGALLWIALLFAGTLSDTLTRAHAPDPNATAAPEALR